MKTQYLSSLVGVLLGSLAVLGQGPAHAFNFTTNYTRALSGSDMHKGDIILNSVELEDGTTLSDFTLVTDVLIRHNDEYVDGDTGAASADIGDLATTGIKSEDASASDIVAVLNNQNLNNIVDTEEKGKFEFDLFFENVVDNIFLWERGMNSKLDVQALDKQGNVVGNLLELGSSAFWQNAGYRIDTQEITGSQAVSSIGIGLGDLGVDGPIHGLRVTSGNWYGGPDWKLMGSVADVPEPSMLLGFGMVVSGVLLRRRQQDSAA